MLQSWVNFTIVIIQVTIKIIIIKKKAENPNKSKK